MAGQTIVVRPRRGRPPVAELEARLRGDILAALREHGPLYGEDLRGLVRGQNCRIDAALRVLVASGVLLRTTGGYVLAEVVW